MSEAARRIRISLPLQLHVLVRRRERPAGDETKAGLRHARAVSVDEAQLPDRRVHGLVVDELLDPVQHRLAPLAIQLGALLPEEPVDVGITSVDVGAAGGHEGLDAGRRIPEGSADAVDEVLQLLLLVALEEPRALEGPDLRADSRRLKIAGRRLAHCRGGGVAPEVAGVEALRVT